MNFTIINKYFIFSLRFFIGFIFIYSGIEKIATPAVFSDAILNYKILNLVLSNIVAITLPWFELLVGVLIMFNINVKENIVFILLLLLVFNVLISSAMIRGLNIDCGCFGSSRGVKVGLLKLAENFGLLLVCCYLYYFSKDSKNKCDVI
ncbi:MAG: MauE/DoxX family redox-associated membrane protein [bacterium]